MEETNTTSYSLPSTEDQDSVKSQSDTYTLPKAIHESQNSSVGSQLFALRNIFIVILTPLLLIWLPIVYNDPKTQCGYVIIIMAVYWITEAVPIAATALIPIFLFPMIGLLPAKVVSATYLNDTSILLFGGLLVAVAIETWNFHKRIALGVLMLVGAEPKWLMAGLMSVTWFLSMWISNTATTAMMIPIVQAVLQQLPASRRDEGTNDTNDTNDTEGKVNGKENFGYEPDKTATKFSVDKQHTDNVVENGGAKEKPDEPRSHRSNTEEANHLRITKALSLCICYSANIGGIGCLTGTAPNLVLNGQADMLFLENNATSPITFTTWMVYALPLSFLTLVVLWMWMTTFFLRCKGICSCFEKGGHDNTQSKVKAVLKQEYRKLGPMTFAQRCILVFFVLLVILWVTRDLGGVGGWGDIFKERLVTDSTPAVFIGFLLFVCPSSLPNVFCFRKYTGGRKPKIEPILKWRDVHEKMPWTLFLVLGAGYNLAKASTESGLSKWLGKELEVFKDLSPYLTLLIICYVVCFATEVISNTAVTTLMMPIMAQLAFTFNVNPLFFMFPTALASSFAFMLPVGTPPNAIVFANGQVRVIDMCSCGFFMNIVSVPIIILATATWGNAFFQFERLPDGFAHMLNTTFN